MQEDFWFRAVETDVVQIDNTLNRKLMNTGLVIVIKISIGISSLPCRIENWSYCNMGWANTTCIAIGVFTPYGQNITQGLSCMQSKSKSGERCVNVTADCRCTQLDTKFPLASWLSRKIVLVVHEFKMLLHACRRNN